jgi:hypothetical protein
MVVSGWLAGAETQHVMRQDWLNQLLSKVSFTLSYCHNYMVDHPTVAQHNPFLK